MGSNCVGGYEISASAEKAGWRIADPAQASHSDDVAVVQQQALPGGGEEQHRGRQSARWVCSPPAGLDEAAWESNEPIEPLSNDNAESLPERSIDFSCAYAPFFFVTSDLVGCNLDEK